MESRGLFALRKLQIRSCAAFFNAFGQKIEHATNSKDEPPCVYCGDAGAVGSRNSAVRKSIAKVKAGLFAENASKFKDEVITQKLLEFGKF